MSARVSVCIPTFNRAHCLGHAIDSVLTQTFRDLELVIRDNASTDGTPELIGRYDDPRLRYSRNESNLGIHRNFDRAGGDAAGDLVILLQDDDMLHPDFLARAVAAFDRNPGLVAYTAYAGSTDRGLDEPPSWLFSDPVFGPDLPIGRDYHSACVWRGPLASVQCLLHSAFVITAFVVRRDVFLRNLPFDIEIGGGADRDFAGRVTAEGPVAVDPWVGAIYRFHGSQTTWQLPGEDVCSLPTARKLMAFYEAHSLDWRALICEWLSLLPPRRRRHWLERAYHYPQPDEVRETIRAFVTREDPAADAIAVALLKKHQPRQEPRPRPRERIKGLARSMTPPALWRGGGLLKDAILRSRDPVAPPPKHPA